MEEQYSQNSDDEVDEDLEAMLYSQIHFEYGEEMNATQHSINSTSEAQPLFSVTPLETENSKVLVKDLPVSREQQSSLFENVLFDSEDPAELEVIKKDRSNSVRKSKSDICGEPTFQTPEVIYLDKPETDCDSPLTQELKPKFDIEAELGIDVSPVTKNCRKTKSKINTQMVKSSTPKSSEIETKFFTSDFIKIDQHKAKQREGDYRKSLSRLLTEKKFKTTVVTKSDTISITSSSDACSNESESDSESETTPSSSESDVVVLGNTKPDLSVNEIAAEPTLDLNWNVNSTDRQTIERVEKNSSVVDESKWKIDDADLMRPQVSRYYAKKEICCRNCDKKGHLSKGCPEAKKKPNCGLCGEEGHVMNRCTRRLCFNCCQPGHKGSDCPLSKRDRFAKCARCLMKGHDEDKCPDLWRQYHLTITSSKDLMPARREVNPNTYCCNCAKRGHFAYECRLERMDKFIFPANPFISKYDVGILSKGRRDKGVSQSSGPQRTWPAEADSEHTPKTKRFKFSHHHSSTPYQLQRNQMFPRGSQSSHRNEPHNQRYYNTGFFSHSTPEQHTPSSHRFRHRPQEKGRQELHSVSQEQGGGTCEKSCLSQYAKKVLKQALDLGSSGRKGHQKRQSDQDQHFDWQGEDVSHHPHKKSRKRQSLPPGKKGNSSCDSPVPHKKKKSPKTGDGSWSQIPHVSQPATQGRADTRKKKDYKQWQGKSGHRSWSHGPQMGNRSWSNNHHTSKTGDRSGNYSPHISQVATQRTGKGKQKNQQKTSFSLPGTSGEERESLVITCKAGFRTTVGTLNCNRNYRNAQY